MIETDFIYSFLTPTERKELDALVEDYKKASGKRKQRLGKRIKEFEEYQLDQVDALIDNDQTETLRGWFESLIDLDPDSPTFLSELDDATAAQTLKELEWWTDQGTEYARDWYFKKNKPGNDNPEMYAQFEQEATDNLRNVLGSLGIDPDTSPENDYNDFTEVYFSRGYDRPEQLSEFRKYVVDTYSREEAADVALNYGEELRESARRNGVTHTNEWFLDAENKVSKGEMNLNAYKEQFRKEAMLRFPQFSDQLKAGEDLFDATAPWQSALKEVLEYTPTSMSDPNLVYAFESVSNDKGMPEVMSIYDYKKWLRNKPEWKETENGRKTIDSVLMGMAKRMGVI